MVPSLMGGKTDKGQGMEPAEAGAFLQTTERFKHFVERRACSYCIDNGKRGVGGSWSPR